MNLFLGIADLDNYNSDDTLSDYSVKLPEHTGDYDKDIPSSPKVPKCKLGQKGKTSLGAETSKANKDIVHVQEEGNETDNSEVFLPCSGTVSSKITCQIKKYLYF